MISNANTYIGRTTLRCDRVQHSELRNSGYRPCAPQLETVRFTMDRLAQAPTYDQAAAHGQDARWLAATAAALPRPEVSAPQDDNTAQVSASRRVVGREASLRRREDRD